MSNIFINKFSSLNFYNLFSRFWELLVGGYLAITEIKQRLNRKNYFVYLPVIGLLLIFISFVTFDKDTLHPSVFTLIPVVGVALIIKYVKFNNIILKILSLKPVIFIGLISYSLYKEITLFLHFTGSLHLAIVL